MHGEPDALRNRSGPGLRRYHERSQQLRRLRECLRRYDGLPDGRLRLPWNGEVLRFRPNGDVLVRQQRSQQLRRMRQRLPYGRELSIWPDRCVRVRVPDGPADVRRRCERSMRRHDDRQQQLRRLRDDLPDQPNVLEQQVRSLRIHRADRHHVRHAAHVRQYRHGPQQLRRVRRAVLGNRNLPGRGVRLSRRRSSLRERRG